VSSAEGVGFMAEFAVALMSRTRIDRINRIQRIYGIEPKRFY
jgi:hypothetical protein